MNISAIMGRIESLSGLSESQIKNYTPEELRSHFESRSGKPLKFVSVFPVIVRGNVLRDGLCSRVEIDRDIDKILGVR